MMKAIDIASKSVWRSRLVPSFPLEWTLIQ